MLILDSDGGSSIGSISKEDRLRLVKERQNEERQKKLEELKSHVSLLRLHHINTPEHTIK